MPRRADPAEVLRFLLTGALNTVVGYLLYLGFLALGMGMALALLAATVLGMMFNFFSFGTLTFRRPPQARRLPRFVAVYAAIYLFNLALLWAVREALGVGPALGQLLCLLVVAPAAYLALKSKVFH